MLSGQSSKSPSLHVSIFFLQVIVLNGNFCLRSYCISLASLSSNPSVEKIPIQPTRYVHSFQKITSCVVPDFETIRQISRQVAKTYPSLSVDDQARLLAYRLKRNQVYSQRIVFIFCFYACIANPRKYMKAVRYV